MAKKRVGRPNIVEGEVLRKLEEVFALGGTDKEACFYAGISHQALYDYQHVHPEFVERKEALKEQPVLLARRTINKALAEDANTAKWYVERRDKDFNPKQEIDVTTKGEKLGNDAALDEAAKTYGIAVTKGKTS